MSDPKMTDAARMLHGEALRAFRKRMKLTLSEVGRVIGHSHGYVSRIETGQRTLSHKHVLRLANATGAEISEILPAHSPLLSDLGVGGFGNAWGGTQMIRPIAPVDQLTQDDLVAMREQLLDLLGEVDQALGTQTPEQAKVSEAVRALLVDDQTESAVPSEMLENVAS
ncbi:hypothetical protein CKO28_01630 [Rhodovibrio sodomensis]|uniref:HTH cro/C1-type domain-containing protein n=1 Tax=Rhodovibrio sodomensis TaxID=1088 RepID=A0ABS1D8P4_9PROT|nr:helix-turn-helix transcriptional regulator [Rhodovibrio sodomensis]MBK1666745.1 hypothetical protein [Rhodovibrio sodomensis]